MLRELPSQHSHRQLLLNSSIVSFSNFLFYLHYPGSFTFEVLYMGCHGCFSPTQASGRECHKWVIEGLGELLRMGSDKNAHRPHQRLTLPRVMTHSPGRALPGAICEMAQPKHSCCHTSYTAFCILCPFVQPLHSMGSVESCRRHTSSKQERGQAWGLQRLLETAQSNGM